MSKVAQDGTSLNERQVFKLQHSFLHALLHCERKLFDSVRTEAKLKVNISLQGLKNGSILAFDKHSCNTLHSQCAS